MIRSKLFVLFALFALFAIPMQTAQAVEYVGPERENISLQPLEVVDGWGDIFTPFAPGFESAHYEVLNVLRVKIERSAQGVIIFGPRQNVSAGQPISVQVTARTITGIGAGIALHVGLVHESGRTVIHEIPALGANQETFTVTWNNIPRAGAVQTVLQVAGRNWNGLAEVEISKPVVTIGNQPVPTEPPTGPTPTPRPPSGDGEIVFTGSQLVIHDAFNKFFARYPSVKQLLSGGAKIMLVGEDDFGANFWFPNSGIAGTINEQAETVTFSLAKLQNEMRGTVIAGIAIVEPGISDPKNYVWMNQDLFKHPDDRVFWRKVSWKNNGDWFIALENQSGTLTVLPGDPEVPIN